MAHVLIVDDSPTDVEAMRGPLTSDGHTASVAESAQDGLDTARREQPDLIFMDVVFEGMSGFQGTRKLVRDSDTAGIPVIMISGKDQETDRIWGLRQGAAEYLVKPVASETLLATANDVLAGRGASA